MALKVIGGEHFSLVAFGVAQVLIDVEPLIRILRGDDVLHGDSHTLGGALLVGAVAIPVAAALLPPLARRWNSAFAMAGRRCSVESRASLHSLVAGSLLGGLTHVALDAVMHADMLPLLPFSRRNPLLFSIGVDALQVGCLALGVASLALWFARRRLLQRKKGGLLKRGARSDGAAVVCRAPRGIGAVRSVRGTAADGTESNPCA